MVRVRDERSGWEWGDIVQLQLLSTQCINPEMFFTASFFYRNVMYMVWGSQKMPDANLHTLGNLHNQANLHM